MEQIKAVWHRIAISKSKLFHAISNGFKLLIRNILGTNRYHRASNFYHSSIQKIDKVYNQYIDRNAVYYKPIVNIWKTIVYGLLGFVFYVFCVETNFLWLCGSMPSIEDLQNPRVAQSAGIYSSDGLQIGKFYTENRTPIDFDSLSPHLIDALVSTEDIRFYDHSGIDQKALLGVALGIVKGDADRGGGSTITQQLAKKLFNTRRKSARGLLGYLPLAKTVIYKTKEWLTAIKLERNFSKQEILTMYFNTVDYGNNTYGIKTASKFYFNKPPHQLKIEEAAVLVGLQKATTSYNPVKNYARAFTRRNTVLKRMVSNQKLSQSKFDSISKQPIVLQVTPERFNDDDNEFAIFQYFNGAVKDYVEKWSEENGYDIYKDGLRIYTTLDSRMQKHAVSSVGERMRSLQQLFENHWAGQNPWRDENGIEIPNFLADAAKKTDYYKQLSKRFKNSPDSVLYFMNKKDTMMVYDWKTGREKQVIMSAMDSLNYYKHILRTGMMAMDPYTGQVKAWVGGLNYKYFKYDAVAQGKRQPGSTFKPFVYCTAIDSSAFNMSPCDKIKDQPFRKEVEENGVKKIWQPKNATGRFTYQDMTLRRALGQSVNSITVQLTDKVGPQAVVNYAHKLGIKSRLQAVPSIGLGSFDVSLMEMIAAYCTFPNAGRYTEPVLVTRIEDSNGKTLEDFVPKTRQAISEESAFLMIHMLKGGMEEPGGTSQNLWTYGSLFQKGFEVGGKTGTTSNNSDGWFMGVTKDLVVGSWVGGEDRSIHFRTMNLGEGSKTALPLVGRFLELVYNDHNLGYQRGPFPKPTITINKSYRDCAPTYPVNKQRDSSDVFSDSLQYLRPTEPTFEETEAPQDTTDSR